MAKPGKRMTSAREKLEPEKLYPVEEALALAKECAGAKFVESVDVAVNLGVDPRKTDQAVRGSSVLPNGTGKDMRVAVFAQGESAEEAKAAGAEIVGFEDLSEKIQKGFMDFDTVIATPDAMKVVGKLGKVLGPRGLMPNPKTGTVTADVGQAVKNAKSGQVKYRTDKAGIIHAPIGRADFEVKALRENLEFLIQDLMKAKPAAAKGHFLKKVAVSSTMGPGISIDHATLEL